MNKFDNPICLACFAISSSIALVVSLSAHAKKLTSPGNAQSCDLTLREDLPDRFYDRYTVIIFQDIDDGLEELSLLAHQLKLLLKLFDPLLWSERFGVDIAQLFSANRRPLAPILPTMLAQPYQNRRPALDAIPHLGLLVGHLSLSSDENSIWRGTPSTYKSSCQSVLGLRLLRNSSRA